MSWQTRYHCSFPYDIGCSSSRGQINNRMLLYNLCLVNSTFNPVFSKTLYKVVRFTDRDLPFVLSVEKRTRMLKSEHLRWLETLVVLGLVEPDDESENDNSDLCMFVTNLIAKANCLKSFA